MKNYQYGLASPMVTNRCSPLVRPKSQHAMISYSQPQHHQTTLRLSKEEPAKKQSRINTSSNEYYFIDYANGRRPIRDLNSTKRNSHIFENQAQKIKNFLTLKIQNAVRDLKQQIKEQSAQIVLMQKMLQKQEMQLETKNNLIQKLLTKVKRQNQIQTTKSNPKNDVFLQRKLRDMQIKIILLIQQMQEEKKQAQKHLYQLSNGLLRQFGSRLLDLKTVISIFIKQRQKTLEKIETELQKVKEKTPKQSQFYRNPNTNVKSDLKNSSDSSVRDTSSSNHSKQQLPNEKNPVVSAQKQQSTCSDYFFHPIQPEQPSIKAIQQLAQQRQQLPIRVFLDRNKRLKYWQSRTFIFDRKGNFTTPSIEEIIYMQKRGWIKLLSQ